jgi:Fe-S cluster assembly protein SufD
MPDLPAFSPEHARHRAAAEAFAEASLPTSEEEVWRYSPIGDLDLERYAPAPPPTTNDGKVPPGAQGIIDLAAGIAAVGAVTVNGHVVWTEPLGGDGGDAVDVGPGDAPDDAVDPVDAFDLLADAFAEPLVVRSAPGSSSDPIVIVHWVDGDGIAAFPRLVVDAGADSDLRVLEVLVSGPGADALVVARTDLAVAKAARVGHLVVQDLAQSVWQIAHQRSQVDADATLTATAAAFGGRYARLRTDCSLVGRGATGNLRAVWFGEADQHLDFRTFQDHAAPDTTSDLVYKGAVGGSSRSVYTGLIKVRPDARGTNAFQTNRNLKLSGDAWAESVPNLEIENNDVRCSHASAVGPVDEEQLWYLESRGVPTAVAERLIVAGFFEEVVGSLPVAAAAGPLRASINGKLDRRGAA